MYRYFVVFIYDGYGGHVMAQNDIITRTYEVTDYTDITMIQAQAENKFLIKNAKLVNLVYLGMVK